MSARTHVSIPPAVQDVLNRSMIIEPEHRGQWRLVLPEQLERKLYESTNKVLLILGGKWDRSAKAHVFSEDPRERLGRALEEGELADTKKITQAYYTPAPLAKRMAQIVRIYFDTHLSRTQRNMRHILEPSAGCGALAEALRVELVEWSTRLHCVEINPDSCGVLRRKGFRHIYECDFLNPEPKFLGLRFTACVMNPPFTKGQDIDHVTTAWSLLAPGGILLALMTPNVETGSTKRHERFRDLLKSAKSYSSELIPAGTFAESGTQIETRLFTIVKSGY